MMDLFELATVNDQVSARHHRENHTAQVRQIKAQLEANSAARLAELEAIEAERQANIQHQRAAQKKQDRLILFTTVGIGGVGLLALIITIVFSG